MRKPGLIRQDLCLSTFSYAGRPKENDVSRHASSLAYQQGVLVAVKLELSLNVKEGIPDHADDDQQAGR